MPAAPSDSPAASAVSLDDWRRAWSLSSRDGSPQELGTLLERLGLPSLAAAVRGVRGGGADRIDAAAFATAADEAALELVAAGVLDRAEAASARDGVDPESQFRAADGSRVWAAGNGRLRGLRGSVTEVVAMPALVSDEGGEGFPSPSVILGVDPPALLERLWNESAPRENGYAPRVLVCEPDAAAAVSALADVLLKSGRDRLRDLLLRDRAVWFVGDGAMRRMEAWLSEHADEALPERVHVTPGTGTAGFVDRVAAVLRDAHAAQARAISGVVPARDVWEPDGGSVRRVQILTSRYTAYVRFSAEDLASEMRAQGVEAEVLQERDGSCHANPLYFARRIDAFRPDLVVCINYLRPHAGGAIPDRVPVVSWIQDAMPHLMGGDGSWRAGARDFVAGYIYPSLRDAFGFDGARTLRWSNPVSAAKFHAGPVGAEHGHHRCEIAMATRHSEPPRTFFERSVRAFGLDTPAGRAARAIGAGIGPVIDGAAEPWRYLNHELAELTTRSLRDAAGADPEPKAASVLLNSFTLPLADLIFRQQAATWAAAAAGRRGWLFRLYGRGWDRHPTLAPHARPELTHGEELRAHEAGAHKQHSGLPLVRRTFEDWDRTRRSLLHHTRAHREADLSMIRGRHPGYAIANHPEAMRVAAAMGALGQTLGHDGLFGMSPSEIEAYESMPAGQRLSPDRDPNRLLIDVSETTFASEAELEQCVELAMSRPRRDGLSRAIGKRCRERFGLDRFARGLLDLVGGRVG